MRFENSIFNSSFIHLIADRWDNHTITQPRFQGNPARPHRNQFLQARGTGNEAADKAIAWPFRREASFSSPRRTIS